MKSFTASILALNFATGTASCTGSVPAGNCLYCRDPDSCGLCKPDFFLTGSTCASSTCNADDSCKDGCQNDGTCCTAENCSTCLFDVAECTNCMPGFWLNNIECLACPGDCAACLNAENCCPIHCAECLSTSSCNLCFSGSPPVGNACGCSTPAQNPKSPCATCNSDSSACLTCVSGHYLHNDACKPCRENCAVCTKSGKVCTTCDAGFYKKGKVCVACSAANCAECSDAATCTVCDEGFYPALGVCEACPDSCKKCNNGGYCTKCDAAYYPKGGVCKPLCEPGYFLNDNCRRCHEDCAACHTDDTADNCCPLHCSACKSDGACNDCFSGISPVTGACGCSTQAQNSKSPCATCNGDSSACTACIDGYFLDATDCAPCSVPNCATCSDAATCTSCATGFEKKGNACNACGVDPALVSGLFAKYSKIFGYYANFFSNKV